MVSHGETGAVVLRQTDGVRGQNAHDKMRDIQRRHWLAMGAGYGVGTADGESAEAVVDDLIARTPHVIKDIQALLPANFPQHLSGTILTGLAAAADRLGS